MFCSSWGRKESDTTERLSWTELKKRKQKAKNWNCLPQSFLTKGGQEVPPYYVPRAGENQNTWGTSPVTTGVVTPYSVHPPSHTACSCVSQVPLVPRSPIQLQDWVPSSGSQDCSYFNEWVQFHPPGVWLLVIWKPWASKWAIYVPFLCPDMQWLNTPAGEERKRRYAAVLGPQWFRNRLKLGRHSERPPPLHPCREGLALVCVFHGRWLCFAFSSLSLVNVIWIGH